MKNTNEKIDSLSKEDKESVDLIKNWLVSNRGYFEYELDDKFITSKIIPLLKLVSHGQIVFESDSITQKLRFPLEMTNGKNEVVSEITELKYRSRYRDRELSNELKKVNLTDEPMKYATAQIAVLTGNTMGVIGKLWDSDGSNTKLIIGLYFLE